MIICAPPQKYSTDKSYFVLNTCHIILRENQNQFLNTFTIENFLINNFKPPPQKKKCH